MTKIFLFHRVNPKREVLWDPMDVPLFDKCIRYISSKYKVVRLEDLVLKNVEKDRKKDFAAIVFDDGYKDNIEFAFPVLERHGVKASFYVVTDCIDKNIPTWTHILDYLFYQTSRAKIHLAFDFLPSELRVEEIPSQEQRTNYVKRLKPALKKISHAQRVEVLQHVESAFSDVELPKLMMNWNDLRTLSDAGHYIGSHTVTHAMLGTMHDAGEIKYELITSAKRIQEEMGYFPSTISYPVGSYNEETKKLSEEAGYKIGLAVNQVPYDPNVQDRFEIPRIELYNEPWLKTVLRIENIHGRLSKFLKRG